jgi:hypothetical protein
MTCSRAGASRAESGSPPTRQIEHLQAGSSEQTGHVLQPVLQFCSRLELHDRDLGELDVASVEPVIGHLKADHRIGRNYLKGRHGDGANAVLAAAGL